MKWCSWSESSRGPIRFWRSRKAATPVFHSRLPIASAEEYSRRFNDAVTEHMAFLARKDILTIEDYMDPRLRERIGQYSPGSTGVFLRSGLSRSRSDAHARVSLVRQGLARGGRTWSPIRRETLLYNIFDTRTEGLATGWEEMMMQAGMLDARPRSRELIYILLAQRAARALGDLKMHSNERTLEEAAEFTSAHTPRGWLSLDGNLVRGEQHLYLQQPAYGTSYVIGKIEIEKILAERKRQLGEDFTMRSFMDEFNATGLIPASLIRWELTGKLPDDVARMLEP